jgi:hypothetical protein
LPRHSCHTPLDALISDYGLSGYFALRLRQVTGSTSFVKRAFDSAGVSVLVS